MVKINKEEHNVNLKKLSPDNASLFNQYKL
jgi:hypothetical protein